MMLNNRKLWRWEVMVRHPENDDLAYPQITGMLSFFFPSLSVRSRFPFKGSSSF